MDYHQRLLQAWLIDGQHSTYSPRKSMRFGSLDLHRKITSFPALIFGPKESKNDLRLVRQIPGRQVSNMDSDFSITRFNIVNICHSLLLRWMRASAMSSICKMFPRASQHICC